MKYTHTTQYITHEGYPIKVTVQLNNATVRNFQKYDVQNHLLDIKFNFKNSLQIRHIHIPIHKVTDEYILSKIPSICVTKQELLNGKNEIINNHEILNQILYDCKEAKINYYNLYGR